jgi:hypothetical protein
MSGMEKIKDHKVLNLLFQDVKYFMAVPNSSYILYKFYKFNPNFGRKIYKTKYGKISGVTFNDNPIEYLENVTIDEIDRYFFSSNNKNHVPIEHDDKDDEYDDEEHEDDDEEVDDGDTSTVRDDDEIINVDYPMLDIEN